MVCNLCVLVSWERALKFLGVEIQHPPAVVTLVPVTCYVMCCDCWEDFACFDMWLRLRGNGSATSVGAGTVPSTAGLHRRGPWPPNALWKVEDANPTKAVQILPIDPLFHLGTFYVAVIYQKASGTAFITRVITSRRRGTFMSGISHDLNLWEASIFLPERPILACHMVLPFFIFGALTCQEQVKKVQ